MLQPLLIYLTVLGLYHCNNQDVSGVNEQVVHARNWSVLVGTAGEAVRAVWRTDATCVPAGVAMRAPGASVGPQAANDDMPADLNVATFHEHHTQLIIWLSLVQVRTIRRPLL